MDKIISDMKSYAYGEYATRIPAKPTVKDTLTRLKELGADLNILTASPHSVLDVCLKRLGIYELFTNVWSCDDFEFTKADAGIYLAAAERIGRSPEEILFVDDNVGAVKTAVSAGMKVCGIYDKSSEDYEGEIRSAADYYAKELCEILEL